VIAFVLVILALFAVYTLQGRLYKAPWKECVTVGAIATFVALLAVVIVNFIFARFGA